LQCIEDEPKSRRGDFRSWSASAKRPLPERQPMNNLLPILLDEMSDALFLFDAERCVVYANPAARRLLRPPEDLLARCATLGHLVRRCADPSRPWSARAGESLLVDIGTSSFEASVFALPEVHGSKASSYATCAVLVRPGCVTTRRPVSDELPPRLHRIGELLSRGLSYKEVSDVTGLSQATVRTYNRQLHERLGVHNRAELVRRWLTDGSS
jgi:PAS domain-containing protein